MRILISTSSHFSLLDLHPYEVTSLISELCVPDVILSEVKGSIVLEHIWDKGHKILANPIFKIIIIIMIIIISHL